MHISVPKKGLSDYEHRYLDRLIARAGSYPARLSGSGKADEKCRDFLQASHALASFSPARDVNAGSVDYKKIPEHAGPGMSKNAGRLCSFCEKIKLRTFPTQQRLMSIIADTAR